MQNEKSLNQLWKESGKLVSYKDFRRQYDEEKESIGTATDLESVNEMRSKLRHFHADGDLPPGGNGNNGADLSFQDVPEMGVLKPMMEPMVMKPISTKQKIPSSMAMPAPAMNWNTIIIVGTLVVITGAFVIYKMNKK